MSSFLRTFSFVDAFCILKLVIILTFLNGAKTQTKSPQISTSVGKYICDQQKVHQETGEIQSPLQARPQNDDSKCGWYIWSKCADLNSESDSCPSFELKMCDEAENPEAKKKGKGISQQQAPLDPCNEVSVTTGENTESGQRFRNRKNRGGQKKRDENENEESGGSSSSFHNNPRKKRKKDGQNHQRGKAPVFCPIYGLANPRSSDNCSGCRVKMWEHLPSACRKCLKDIFEGNSYCHRCGTPVVQLQQMEMDENSDNNNQNHNKTRV